jgi:hypothetical protein
MTFLESVRRALKHNGDRPGPGQIAGVTVEPHDLVGYVSQMPASVDIAYVRSGHIGNGHLQSKCNLSAGANTTRGIKGSAT